MNGIKEEINQKIQEIEEKEHVTVLHAVESGSRAWGFASPDSDYDVRFIYVRPKEDYLVLNEPRDVIEWQLDEVLDINGWDLKKALIQFHRGNATLFEWANSPIVYKTTEAWSRIYHTAKNYFSVKAAGYHYYGTANTTYCHYLGEDRVNYKKYFYALRPLLACRFLQEYQCPPPVLFDDLLKMDMPQDLRDGIRKLLEIKKKSDEKDKNEQIPVIRDFIANEIARQKLFQDETADDRKPEWQELNNCFLDALK